MSLRNYQEFLLELDPDELVDVLQLSPEDIIKAFPDQVYAAYKREDNDDGLPWDQD